MKKFFKAIALAVFVIVAISLVVDYNNRPLPFEGKETTPSKMQTLAEDASNKVDGWLKDASEKIEEVEIPDFTIPESDSNSKTSETNKNVNFADVNVAAPMNSNYDRDSYGSAWADVDMNGCDTRNDILARDLENVVKSSDCKVKEGVLKDSYTSKTIEHKTGVIDGVKHRSNVQIDHIVPLSYANKYGASNWSAETKEKFANDPANLKAVDGSANMSKSDSGPSDWMPTNSDYHCEYAKSFAKVIVTYELSVSKADKVAMESAC